MNLNVFAVKRIPLAVLIFNIFIFNACLDVSDDDLGQSNDLKLNIEELAVPEAFDYATTSSFQLQIEVLDNEDNPIENVPIEILSGFPESGGNTIAYGGTTEEGTLDLALNVGTNLDSLYIRTPYYGLPSWHRISLNDSEMVYTIGGTNPSEGVINRSVSATSNLQSPPLSGPQFRRTSNPSKYVYFGAYNSDGLPDYLLPERDYISGDLLSLINNSLPERRPVPYYNPQYIADSIKGDIELNEEADIWITFVHEGAGYRNALGFYKYSLSNPPLSTDDIDSLFIIFPNASFRNSGGSLTSGDKVHLGRYPSGTGIGFFLVPNGWDGSQVNGGIRGEIKYTDRNLNTFTDEANSSHTVLLKDDARELLILGMEDISRPRGDKDFNDAIFYITANSYSAIRNDDFAESQPLAGNDNDSDGVNNQHDEFPEDPTKAFQIELPGKNIDGTFVFEDFWPRKGDFDLNDMVIGYHYTAITNTANRVVELEATFKIRAMGAGFRNGFGFQLDIDPSLVQSVTGYNLTNNLVTLASNGTEANQSKAVIIAFDDGFSLMRNPDGGFVNTEPSTSFLEPVEISLTIIFTEPIVRSALGFAPFNPFIFTNGNRNVEVHLPDQAPTDLADVTLFGTEDDDSRPNQSRYYKTKNHLPWALHFVYEFKYPIEKEPILRVYNLFGPWAESGGMVDKTWYETISNNNSVYSP